MPNIPVYVIAILLLVIVGGGGYCVLHSKYQDARYEKLDNKHRTFVAETAAAGSEAKSRELELTNAYSQLAYKVRQNDVANMVAIDNLHADYQRMLNNERSTHSGKMRTLAGALREAEIACDGSRLTTALERLEDGVLQKLVKPRDEAIVLANSCLAMLDGIYKARGQ